MYRSRADRLRELDQRKPAATVPRWLLYVVFVAVAVYLLARAEFVAAAVFAALTVIGLLVQRFAVG